MLELEAIVWLPSIDRTFHLTDKKNWGTKHCLAQGQKFFIKNSILLAILSCFSCVWFFVTLWTVACQPPLSMGFFRQEYWSGLLFPPAGDLSNPGITPASLRSGALVGGFSLGLISTPLKNSVLCFQQLKTTILQVNMQIAFSILTMKQQSRKHRFLKNSYDIFLY